MAVLHFHLDSATLGNDDLHNDPASYVVQNQWPSNFSNYHAAFGQPQPDPNITGDDLFSVLLWGIMNDSKTLVLAVTINGFVFNKDNLATLGSMRRNQTVDQYDTFEFTVNGGISASTSSGTSTLLVTTQLNGEVGTADSYSLYFNISYNSRTGKYKFTKTAGQGLVDV